MDERFSHVMQYHEAERTREKKRHMMNEESGGDYIISLSMVNAL
jgi:hypothetical protein